MTMRQAGRRLAGEKGEYGKSVHRQNAKPKRGEIWKSSIGERDVYAYAAQGSRKAGACRQKGGMPGVGEMRMERGRRGRVGVRW